MSKKDISINYMDMGSYVCGTRTDNGFTFIIDHNDLEMVKDFHWWSNNGYPRAIISGKRVLMHRYILGVVDKRVIVDHINGDRSDNRRLNLRIVSHQQNSLNRKVGKNNSSGVMGVKYNKEMDKWQARLGSGGLYYMGSYQNKKDAIVARLRKEIEIYGREFSPQRGLFEKYGL